ncbi:MAG: phosphoesterase [Planctomycetaceae bacterium]|nr:MAG: phosphoesterase [Planctomycetaceae bacterium]
MSNSEHVLCIPTALLHEVGYFQGFQPDVERYLAILFDSEHTCFMPRDQVETDPRYKQLIPYCIFKHSDQVFHYRRGGQGGEQRLHAKRSIGIGGHISSTDSLSGDRRYLAAMRREIEEEVNLEASSSHRCLGLINDDQTPVGQVHLGIVHLFELDSAKVSPREESILETGFARPDELWRERQAFETWSQICLEHLLTLQPFTRLVEGRTI